MAVALALGERGVGRTGNNPSVGCVIVKEGRVVGRGWTQPGGRPHAEAMALKEAGSLAQGATVFCTLEPCAHLSDRGAACSDSLIAAGVAHVIIAMKDPDHRTAGKGIERIRDAGIDVEVGVMASQAVRSLAGFLMRVERGRPYVTLKLATSLDGAIATANGESKWITGEAARAHTHLERARCDAILVGAGTVRNDNPLLDVRLEGLEGRSPRRIMLGSGSAPDGWLAISNVCDIALLEYNRLLVEGGAQTAAAFLTAGLVDRLLIYRAPIIIGGGVPCIADVGLPSLGDAHDRWRLTDARRLGNDWMEVYEASHPAI